jgi:hypothetical protein
LQYKDGGGELLDSQMVLDKLDDDEEDLEGDQ